MDGAGCRGDLRGGKRFGIPCHRMVVAPGEIVLRDTRLVRIEARILKSLACVRDLATGQREDVPLADLRGRAVVQP